MAKRKFTKFEGAFELEELKTKLSGLMPLSAYSFTKRNNPTEFSNLLTLLPEGYITKQENNIESIDLIYSGSANVPFLLTLIVGRNDTFNRQEKYDTDVLNIAPDTNIATSFFSYFWHHFKNEKDERTSYNIHPTIITNEEVKKDVTYGVFLTGSNSYSNFEDYQKAKPDYYKSHCKSFENLKI